MFRHLFAGASLLAVAASVSAGTLQEDAKAFGTRQLIQNVDISPSGKKVVMLVSASGASTVANVIDVDTGTMTRVAATDGKPERLFWCSFAGEEHLVCRYGGIDHVGTELVGFSRLVTVKADGSNLRPIGQKDSDRARYIRQSDGSVIDWLNAQEGQILMERTYVPDVGTTGRLINRTKEGLGVDQIDLESLRSTQVEPPRGADTYMTDGRGNIRLSGRWLADRVSSRLSGDFEYRYRKPGSRNWEDLGSYNSASRTGALPLAIDGERNVLFARKRMNGRDALVQIALDGSNRETTIATNDIVDIDDVVRFGRGQRVIGYTYADERRRVTYFDPEFEKLHAALGQALPRQPSISFQESSRDGQQLLILAGGDIAPGTFYVYSRSTKSLKEVAPIRPELEGRSLAQVKAIEVPAPDGVTIPAYLTTPPGSSGRNLPAVVLPHGGPSARDEWGFDWLPQFLAARGYAVIQPNYRGSDGYGDAWLAKNGFQGWKTSIGDVSAAARYLVAQGIADPARLAIVGWSYGGYAALQSAAVEPALYKAAVAIAPVTDLAMTKKEAEGYANRDLVRQFIGDGPHITEGSPLQQAGKINIPVLLAHGDLDVNVGIRQSQVMLNALKGAGAPVELLSFKGLDHQLDDSDARIALLTKMGELLDRTIGK